MSGVSELWAEIVAWMGRIHPTPLKGVYTGTTEAAGLGPFKVTLNAQNVESDDLGPFDALIENEGEWPLCVVGPAGGGVICSPNEGENEAGLIEHFRSQATGDQT